MRDWTSEQRQAIDVALRSAVDEYPGSSSTSFEKLLEQWQVFVREVEAGYTMSIYDYTNDLSTRDLIEEVLRRTPSSLQAALRAEVEPWDDRYRLATKPSDTPILPGPDVADNPRWRRIPRALIGELRDDFLNEGIIAET
jgi:hypothetical protein